jgi:hypothetical protein
MENNFDTKIDGLKTKLEIRYLHELQKKLEEDGSDYHLTELVEKITCCKNTLQTNNNPPEKNTPEKTENTFENIDQYMFKRPWNRLPEIHKLIKIKEYVNQSLIIYESNNKDILIKEMFAAIKDKKLTRKGSVNYDPIKGRVVSIPSLQYDKSKETYFLIKL